MDKRLKHRQFGPMTPGNSDVVVVFFNSLHHIPPLDMEAAQGDSSLSSRQSEATRDHSRTGV